MEEYKIRVHMLDGTYKDLEIGTRYYCLWDSKFCSLFLCEKFRLQYEIKDWVDKKFEEQWDNWEIIY